MIGPVELLIQMLLLAIPKTLFSQTPETQGINRPFNNLLEEE